MPRLVLLVLHGMGVVDTDYYIELQAGLAERLGARWHEVSLQPVYYGDLFHINEQKVWDAFEANPQNKLGWAGVRQFFLFRFADATAFERSFHVERATYQEVQDRIVEKLREGFQVCAEHPGTPLVVLSHSLGCQVFSSYAWDVMHPRHPAPATPPEEFSSLHTWRRFLTMGCNIPIFTAGLSRRQNFQMKPGFEWHNYYDPCDVLGWPMAQLDEKGSYEGVKDYPFFVGDLLTRWTPLSHMAYWSDGRLLDRFAAHLLEVLDA
ncbi:MAG: hypothetical protein JO006_04270 [Paucibacter sp.]|nr:hypothetical protein [Roseateles sp.]